MYSKRVMFPGDGTLTAVRVYHIWSDTRPGYHLGDGGTYTYELRTDDGTSDNFPSATVLGSVAAVPGRGSSKFPRIVFDTPIPVSANTWYHLVCYNTHARAAENFVSMDDILACGPNPVIPAKQLAVMYKGANGWVVRRNYVAIADFEFEDGTHFGCGFMEKGSTGDGTYRHTVSGDAKVRQVIQVSGADKQVVSVHVGMMRISGSDSITVSLVTPGQTYQAAALPPMETSLRDNFAWARFDLSATLESGTTCFLELSAPSSSEYHLGASRDGNEAGYGFHENTVFSDGYAQFCEDGSTWVDWDTWGKPRPRKDQDVAFYFNLEQKPTATGAAAPVRCFTVLPQSEWSALVRIVPDGYSNYRLSAGTHRFAGTRFVDICGRRIPAPSAPGFVLKQIFQNGPAERR